MTVHSNDGLSWLTKLERIGEKSAANKREMFSNLGHLVNVDMLKGQFLRLDGNKATGIDGMTKAAYGGVPEILVSDNLKIAVSKACR